jgi:hypothetical protein
VRVGSVELGDDVGGRCQAPIRNLAASASHVVVAGGGRDARERIEGEDLCRRVVRPSGRVEDRLQALLCAWHLIRRVDGGQQAFAEDGLFPTAGFAVPGRRRFKRRACLRVVAGRPEDPTQVHPGQRH